LHVDVCLPGATQAFAPFDATIVLDGHHLILSSPDVSLHLDGIDCSLENGASVNAGDEIGVVSGTAGGVGGLRIQLCRDPDLVPPLFARPQQSAIWRRICPSPSRLLGIGVDAPAPKSEALLERRKKSFAKPQKNYYADPPQIERGWKEHLFDVKGRAYLDMVNNVTILGHGHPRVAEAVGRQWSMQPSPSFPTGWHHSPRKAWTRSFWSILALKPSISRCVSLGPIAATATY
jgi:hypothetical protein